MTDRPHEPSGNRWEGQHDTAPVTPHPGDPHPVAQPTDHPVLPATSAAAPSAAPAPAQRRGWRSAVTGTRAAIAGGLAVALLAVGGAGFAIGRAVGGSDSPATPTGRFGQVDGGPGRGGPGDGGRGGFDRDHDGFGPGQDDGQQDGSQDGQQPPSDS